MELREALELVNVEYESDGKKAVMTFLDRERKEVRVVNFNKQIYKDGKYVDDAAKAEQVEKWCTDIFGATFDDLDKCLGARKDVYVYDRFNALWEVEQICKFTPDMKGQIYQTAVKEVLLDDYFIKIRYEIDGDTYESKQTFGVYLEATKEWFVDPLKKEKEYQKFEEKYHCSVEDREQLVGHPLMVEVKAAFGTHLYGDIKKFPKEK